MRFLRCAALSLLAALLLPGTSQAGSFTDFQLIVGPAGSEMTLTWDMLVANSTSMIEPNADSGRNIPTWIQMSPMNAFVGSSKPLSSCPIPVTSEDMTCSRIKRTKEECQLPIKSKPCECSPKPRHNSKGMGILVPVTPLHLIQTINKK